MKKERQKFKERKALSERKIVFLSLHPVCFYNAQRKQTKTLPIDNMQTMKKQKI